MCSLNNVIIFQGTVTKIEFSLLYFEIDDKFRIYIDLTKNEAEFPTLKDNVEIVDPVIFHGPTYTAVIGPLTNCQFLAVTKLTDSTDIDFYNCLKINNCSEHALISIDAILRKLNYVSNSILQKIIKLVFENATCLKIGNVTNVSTLII